MIVYIRRVIRIEGVVIEESVAEAARDELAALEGRGCSLQCTADIGAFRFRSGKIRVLVVSKVANFAIDLPDASLAIQVSGTFGSRQEEAQRLGRILRPKERTSRFYTLITRNTVEEEFGSNRQKFLAEQGYQYRIVRYSPGCEL